MQIYELEQNVPPELWEDFQNIQIFVLKVEARIWMDFSDKLKRWKPKVNKSENHLRANETLQPY